MANLPGLPSNYENKGSVEREVRNIKSHTHAELETALQEGTLDGVQFERAARWARGSNRKQFDALYGTARPLLPICPYGCTREGTLLEIVMGTDGRALGIFNDHPCSCIFVADIQLGEPPTSRKLELGLDGEYHEVEG